MHNTEETTGWNDGRDDEGEQPTTITAIRFDGPDGFVEVRGCTREKWEGVKNAVDAWFDEEEKDA